MIEDKSLFEIINILEDKIPNLDAGEIFEFELENPDYKALVDLAQINYCKFISPKILDDKIIVRFQKLNIDVSFHKENDDKEKYGTDSIFGQINKINQPAFLHYYLQALKNVDINKRIRVLNLGVNSGDEFEIIKQYSKSFENLELTGLDYCPSAIKKAKEKFKDDKNIRLLEADINNLDSFNLGTFDLIISIGTLQSVNSNFKLLFQDIVQKYLKKDGAMILGFPNCRWIDGEMIYGAQPKNYNFPEMTVLYNDAQFCKKYLQQKKFRVTLTGKEYIFLTATSIRKD
ncbi:MAG: methyltransferase domain-containing protein [Campylobacteraceae bacterium]|nr:methyltransferase domain-containing protein [Campylobacteraceae bacterium]